MISTILKSCVIGFQQPFIAGARIVQHPRLLVLSLLPVAISLTLSITLMSGLHALILGWATNALTGLGFDPTGGFVWFATLMLQVFVFLGGILVFAMATTLAASPFNDVLAESAERWATPPLAPVADLPFWHWVRHTRRVLWIDFIKTLATGAASILTLLLSWVPIINVIAFLISLLLVTFQFTSYPQTRRRQTLGDGVRFVLTHPFSSLGFGLAAILLLAVPIVSAFTWPLVVVGGTLLVGRAQKHPQFMTLR